VLCKLTTTMECGSMDDLSFYFQLTKSVFRP
jgi:hypothetical protein